MLKILQTQLEQMVALAVLAPIVASQGGNSATQTMTVTVRALATRELYPRQRFAHHLARAGIGAFNGAAFGLITGLVAANWFQNVGLGQ